MGNLPYLTASIAGVSGVYKERWEDFVVEEIPRVAPAGHGDHCWFEVEKHGLTTITAAADLARALGVRSSTVGYAGMKDGRAIARQWMSVEHVEPERLLALAIPRIRVLGAARHPRKLRRGWHAGNRFLIRLRHVVGEDVIGSASVVLGELERRGVPNYYGPQRFGSRGDSWRVGRALARGEWADAAAMVAGSPLRPTDPSIDDAGVSADSGDILGARELFDAGRYREAAAAWPRGFGQCARVAAAMDRTGGDARRALLVVGKGWLRLYASAYQSWLFNQVLARRVPGVDDLLPGDLAWKHDSEALFEVDDPAAERPRAARFEISATAPLVGRRMREPGGAVRELERSVLEEAGFRATELDSSVLRPVSGRRRPVRFRMKEVAARRGTDAAGAYLELRFALPPGCYATAVLRELGKGRIVERGTSVALCGDACHTGNGEETDE